MCSTGALSSLERRLIDAFQRGLPMVARPFEAMAQQLGESEEAVLAACQRLMEAGVVGRVGPVLAANRAGASTLAAMAVPPERLDSVAAMVSARPDVSHNYEREHRFNLWFVVAGPDRAFIDAALADIEREAGLAVLDLPMLRAYRIDLGFPVQWN